MVDSIFLWLFRQQVRIYKWFTGRSRLDGNADLQAQIDDLLANNERAAHECERLNGNISDLKNQNDNLNHSVKVLHTEVSRQSQEISELFLTKRRWTKEKHLLEKEKEDALIRISEVVSVRLRDNNPNIVDLNDPCRPTKLAEMFSELYDNEWTSAYARLEGRFTETQAIVFLLDMVMESYEFCEERMEEQWNSLEKWFLNSNLPGAQQTFSWLKCIRKATILEKLQEVDTEFEGLLDKMCKEEAVKRLLSDSVIKSYITKCVELCLLMVTTDPPVVLGCPNWESSKKLSVTEENEVNTDDDEKEDNRTVGEEQSHGEVGGAKKGKPYVRSLYGEQFDGDQVTNKEPVEQKGSNAVIPTKRTPFEHETFKEYTVRGKYLDFIVWPALYLHKGGPLLAKGIAQGSKKEWNEQGNTNWIWRRKLSFVVE